MCTKRYLAKKLTPIATAVTAVAAVLLSFAGAPTTQAQTIYPDTISPPSYFVPSGNYFHTNHNPDVIQGYYYDPYTPVFRSQRGRETSTNPTTGNYDTGTSEDSGMNHERYKQSVRSVFDRVSANNADILYDNSSLPDATLDLRSLTSHTCFDPTGAELSNCTQRFGPFADLKSSILNGTLFSVLTEDDVDSNMRALYERMVKQISEQDNNGEITSVLEMLRESRKLRSQLLWEICRNMFPSYDSAGECFQRNSRLALDRDLNVNITPSKVQ